MRIDSPLNTLRQNLKTAVAALDRNGNGSLAHQEISQSALPKEIKKVLAQATSRAANSRDGQSVENVQRWVDRFVDEFAQFDADRSGTLSAEEISAAEPFRQQHQLRALQKALHADAFQTDARGI